MISKIDDLIDLKPDLSEYEKDAFIDLCPQLDGFRPPPPIPSIGSCPDRTRNDEFTRPPLRRDENTWGTKRFKRKKSHKKSVVIGAMFVMAVILTASLTVLLYGNTISKKDSDGDGIIDYIELNVYKTNPNKKDTDGDGLNDKDEIDIYHTDPRNLDSDSDGISDNQEVQVYKTDPTNFDSDGDGVPDGIEINTYNSNPLEDADVRQENGLLLYDPEKVESHERTRGTSSTWDALFVNGLKNGNDMTVNEITIAGNPMSAYGNFTLECVDEIRDIWEIVNTEYTDTTTMPTISELENNIGMYSFKKVDLTLEDSVGLVYNNHTIGMSLKENIVYVGLDSFPTFFTPVSLSGVLLPKSAYDYLDLLLDVDVVKEFRDIQEVIDKTKSMELPMGIILADSIEYEDATTLTGDVLASISPEKVEKVTGEIFGLSSDDYGFLLELVSKSDMELLIMNEKTNPKDIWFLLTPIYNENSLQGIITLDNVVETTKEDIENSLGIEIPDIKLDLPFNLKFGICADKTPMQETTLDIIVRGLWDPHILINTAPAPIRVDSYFTWTTASDILEYLGETQGIDEENLEALKMLNALGEPVFSLLIQSNNIDDIKKCTAIGIGVSCGDEDAVLLRGNLNGVVYNLGNLLDNENIEIPLIIVDNYDLYDEKVVIDISRLDASPNNYVTTDQNEMMISTEGFVIGTTLKTIAEIAANAVPALKIFEYLPFDIGLYDLSWFDEQTTTLYHLPIIVVVEGKGETYLGEYMEVEGWFDRSTEVEELTNSIADGIGENGNLPNFLKDYLVSFLNGSNSNDIFNSIQSYFSGEFTSYLGDLGTNITSRIDGLVNGFQMLMDTIDGVTDNIDDSVERDLEGRMADVGELIIELENLPTMIANKIDYLMNLIDENDDGFFDFGSIWNPGDFLGGIGDLLEGMGWDTMEGFTNDPDHFHFLSTLLENTTNLQTSLSDLRENLMNNISGLIEKIQVVINDLGTLTFDIMESFSDYIENIDVDLVETITSEFVNLFYEKFEFFLAIAQAFTVEQIEGYIMVYQMENGESPYMF